MLRRKLMFFIYNSTLKEPTPEPIWCEYIEGDDNQYIRTIPITGNNPKISISFMPIKNGKNNLIGITSGARGFFTYSNGQTQIAFYAGDSGYYTIGVPSMSEVNVATFSADLVAKKAVFTMNSSTSSEATFTTFNSTGVYDLFRYNASPQGSFKLYGCQFYDKDKLIADFKPCLNPETKRPALYDLIEKKYYYNRGSGEFTYALL